MSILADKDTNIIIQGITGREASNFTKDCISYGAKIVAGTTPGKGGRVIHGVPVYDCISDIVKEYCVDVSIVSVPPNFVKDAAYEAIDNGIRLIVIITERVPIRDVVEVISLANEKGITVIGPNSLGLISPGKTKVGMIGGPVEDTNKAYQVGFVGIMSRSGGMTTELANLLTVNGIGQSTCISLGGDPVIGSTFVDMMPCFEKDPGTKAVLIFCEPGGSMEEDLAEYVSKRQNLIPIVAFVAGRFADRMPGVRFGHAASIVEGNKGSTKEKIRRFKESGIIVAEELSEIPDLIKNAVLM